MDLWTRITSFSGEKEFLDFVRRVDRAVADGLAGDVKTDPNYGRAMIYGGRWISCEKTGEVWRLVTPQPPFMGLWEPVLIAGLSPTTPACAEARRRDSVKTPATPTPTPTPTPKHRLNPKPPARPGRSVAEPVRVRGRRPPDPSD